MSYFNSAAAGLIDPDAIQKANQFNLEYASMGSERSNQWKVEDLPAIKSTVRTFFNSQEMELGLIPNFSYAFNALVQSIKGKVNNVLLYENDYPSVLMPFQNNNFSITYVKDQEHFRISLDQIKIACEQNKIELIAISHVQYLTGFVIDISALSEYCRRKGILLFVDTTQSAGALPIDMDALQADVVLNSNYKWMNAGFGSGLLFLNPAFTKTFPPIIMGNGSYVAREGGWQYVPGSASFEPGHQNMSGLLVLKKAIELKLQQGIHTIAEHNLQLTELFTSYLDKDKWSILGENSLEGDRKNIVVLKSTPTLLNTLSELGCQYTARNGYCRLSFHYHNTVEEIERLNKALD